MRSITTFCSDSDLSHEKQSKKSKSLQKMFHWDYVLKDTRNILFRNLYEKAKEVTSTQKGKAEAHQLYG